MAPAQSAGSGHSVRRNAAPRERRLCVSSCHQISAFRGLMAPVLVSGLSLSLFQGAFGLAWPTTCISLHIAITAAPTSSRSTQVASLSWFGKPFGAGLISPGRVHA
jgi:hypothetical protein